MVGRVLDQFIDSGVFTVIVATDQRGIFKTHVREAPRRDPPSKFEGVYENDKSNSAIEGFDVPTVAGLIRLPTTQAALAPGALRGRHQLPLPIFLQIHLFN